MRAYYPIITEVDYGLPFYVTGIGICENECGVDRPSGLKEYHWLYCVQGSGVLEIDGQAFTIDSRMGFFFLPDVPHKYYPVEEPWETHWITFLGHGVDSLIYIGKNTGWDVFQISDLTLIEGLFHELFETTGNERTRGNDEISVLLYRFLLCIKKNIKTSTSSPSYQYQKQLEPVILHLKNNLYTNPTLDELAVLLHVTPSHLCRLFKKAYNIRPFIYITKLRIQKAKELIAHGGDIPISEVAQAVGYNSTSYFCLHFKKYEGLTPSEFRNSIVT